MRRGPRHLGRREKLRSRTRARIRKTIPFVKPIPVVDEGAMLDVARFRPKLVQHPRLKPYFEEISNKYYERYRAGDLIAALKLSWKAPKAFDWAEEPSADIRFRRPDTFQQFYKEKKKEARLRARDISIYQQVYLARECFAPDIPENRPSRERNGKIEFVSPEDWPMTWQEIYDDLSKIYGLSPKRVERIYSYIAKHYRHPTFLFPDGTNLTIPILILQGEKAIKGTVVAAKVSSSEDQEKVVEPVTPLEETDGFVEATLRRAKFEQLSEGGSWLGEIPDIPEVRGAGLTKEECLQDLREALKNWLAQNPKDGDNYISIQEVE